MLTTTMLLTACNLAPRCERPAMPIPNQYKEFGRWVRVKPTLWQAKKDCPRRMMFHDQALNELQQKLTKRNPSLHLAYSRFQAARAMTQAVRSQLYPTIILAGAQSRQQNSKTVANIYSGTTFFYNTASIEAMLSYEVDTWGQIRNTISASAHAARASQFDLAAMELSLHAMLADLYFELRGDDDIQRALDRLVRAYEHAYYLMHQLHLGGAVLAFSS